MRGLWWGLLALFALLFLPQLFFHDTPLYSEILTDRVVITIAAPIKLALLVLGAVFGWQAGAALGAHNPAGPPWRLLSLGLALLAGGQAVLTTYQVMLAVPAPFPSLADPLFVLGTLLLVVATVMFVVIYARSGLGLGTAREIALVLAVGAVIPVVLVVVVLRPIAAADEPWEKALLNLGYPAIDMALIVPTLVLLRMMLKMRGGKLWLVWARLLAAIACTTIGDILFAYFTTLGFSTLDPLLHLAFAYAYVLWAWGTYTQRQIGRGG